MVVILEARINNYLYFLYMLAPNPWYSNYS